MGATKLLGAFNGAVIGTFVGVTWYAAATDALTVLGVVGATLDVGGYAVGAATSTTVTSRVTAYPPGPIWAGLLGGAVAAALVLYVPTLIDTPVASDVAQQLLTGLIAGGVIGTLTRFLPGL